MQIRWQAVVTILIIYIPTVIKFMKDRKKKKNNEKDKDLEHNYVNYRSNKKEVSFSREFLNVSKNKDGNLENRKKILAKELLDYLDSNQRKILEEKYFSPTGEGKAKFYEDDDSIIGEYKNDLNKEDVYESRLGRLKKINEERMSYKNDENNDENILEEFNNEVDNGFDEKELVNALIMKEILDKPVSLR